MSLTDSGVGAADLAAIVGNNDGFGNGSGALWLLIFLFAMNNGGWGGNWGGNNGVPYMMYNGVQSDMQRGFDQAAISSSLGSLQTTVANGFANAEVARCNQATNMLQSLYTLQSGLGGQINDVALGQQAAIAANNANYADLKYVVATENCQDRYESANNTRDIIDTVNNKVQGIYDKLCQLEMDGLKEQNATLRNENSALRFNQSQTAQTAQILADNAAQSAMLSREINPPVNAAYIVPNPNSVYYTNYGTPWNNGCGGFNGFNGFNGFMG